MLSGANESTFSCNLKLKQIDSINKYLGTPHASSLIALTSIDTANKNINMTIKCPNAFESSSLTQDIIDVWSKYKPIKVYLRSCKTGDKFLTSIDNRDLETKNIARPSSIDMYKGNDVLIDMLMSDGTTCFNIYRWGEPGQRKIFIETIDSEYSEYAQYEFNDEDEQ